MNGQVQAQQFGGVQGRGGDLGIAAVDQDLHLDLFAAQAVGVIGAK